MVYLKMKMNISYVLVLQNYFMCLRSLLLATQLDKEDQKVIRYVC